MKASAKASAEHLREEIVHVHTVLHAALGKGLHAVRVIHLSFLVVLEDLVGLTDQLEMRRCLIPFFERSLVRVVS